MEEIKAMALSLSFLVPLIWAITIIVSGKMKYASIRHLFFLLITSSFMYLMVYAKFMWHIELYTYLFFMQGLACAIIFPLFYLYVYVLTSEKIKYNWQYYIHYLMPSLFFLSTFIIFNVWLDHNEAVNTMSNILHSKLPERNEFTLAYKYYDFGKFYFMLSSVFYMLLIYFRYTSHKQNIANIFSSDKNNELTWIKTIGYFYIISVFFNLVIQYMRNTDIDNNNLLISISYFIFSLFFWFLGLFGYLQKDIYSEIKIENTEVYTEGVKVSKMALKQYIEDDKPYLKTDISIYDFCFVFGTNRTYLSESINKIFNVNFRTLINKYRIEEAKNIINKLQLNNMVVLLEEVASQSGFNSYSSFLRVFKLHEGIAPSDYLKNINTTKSS